MGKECTRCLEILPEGEFNTGNAPDGLTYACRTCRSKQDKRRYDRNPQARREYSRTWREANPDYMKNYRLMANYGITVADRDRMLKDQGGVCAICAGIDWGNNSPNVDHDHETGKVRGLLCSMCNGGLGQFRDDIELLGKAAEYLKRNRREETRP